MATRPLTGQVGDTAQIVSVAADQTVAVGASSAQSTAFARTTQAIRVCSDVACWYAVGVNPTAAVTTAGSKRLPADAIEFIGVAGGDKIAFIREASTSGNASVSEVI